MTGGEVAAVSAVLAGILTMFASALSLRRPGLLAAMGAVLALSGCYFLRGGLLV